MAAYGCRCYNEKGMETGTIDGRSFCLEVVPVNINNTVGSRTYPDVDYEKYSLDVFIAGSSGVAGCYTTVTISGTTVSWNASYAADESIAAYIFINLVEK